MQPRCRGAQPASQEACVTRAPPPPWRPELTVLSIGDSPRRPWAAAKPLWQGRYRVPLKAKASLKDCRMGKRVPDPPDPSKKAGRAFNIADLERILRAIQPELPQEPLLQMLSGLDSVFEKQEELGKSLQELRDMGADKIDVNFVGIVSVLPLRFSWIGIAAFVIVNVLANTLTVAGLAAFLGTVTGITFKDDLLEIASLVGNVRDGTVSAEQGLNSARAQVDYLLNKATITNRELAAVATTLETAAAPLLLARQHNSTLGERLITFAHTLTQAGFE